MGKNCEIINFSQRDGPVHEDEQADRREWAQLKKCSPATDDEKYEPAGLVPDGIIGGLMEGLARAEQAEERIRQRSTALRSIASSLSKVQTRRKSLEQAVLLGHSGRLMLRTPPALDDLLLAHKSTRTYAASAPASIATPTPQSSLSKFTLKSISLNTGGGEYLWCAPHGDAALGSLHAWAGAQGMERHVSRAEAQMLTGRFAEAKRELDKANAAGGKSAHKHFRLQSCRALALLAQGELY
jgi:hypothetical protein